MKDFQGLVKSKLPKTGTSIFAVMTALAQKHNAINVAQGFPDFDCSPELVSLVNQYMKKGMNQYAPMPGIMSLREAIAEKMQDLYSAKYNPDTEISICMGATQAIYTVMAAMLQPGDEVIVFEPMYDSYVPSIELNGGIPVYVQLKAPDYSIDWNEVKKLVNHRTRMIMINTPHNPTGAILTQKDLQQLDKITRGTDIVVVSDEVYEHIIFDNQSHQSVARFPQLAERSFVVFSYGKCYHTTGWKMGYVLAPASLTAEFRKVHQFMLFCANAPIQYALADYMKNKDAYLSLNAFFQKKRDYFISLIKGSKFKLRPSQGSYFQSLDYSAISKEKDADFAMRLTKDYGVASIPVSVFYHKPVDNKLLRFCFAKKEETMEKAAERLLKIV